MARSYADVQVAPYYVYVLQNKITGHCYVGQTKNFANRLRWHRKNLKWVIGRAIRKHGIENFSWSVHEVPEALADRFERNLIMLYGSLSPNGYNIEGGGNKYKHVSLDTRRKISEAHIGKRPSAETRRRLSEARKGRTFSEETRKRISEAKRGKRFPPLSAEHRKKISEALKGRGNFAGRRHSLETRAKMSAAQFKRRAEVWP